MRLSLLLGLLAGGQVALGLAFQLTVLGSFGAGWQADAFFTSLLPVLLIAGMLADPLLNVLIPELSLREGPARGRDAWTLLALTLVALAPLAVGLGWTAGRWIGWLAPGFDDPTRALAARLVRLQLPALVLIPLAAILRAADHAGRRFLRCEWTLFVGHAAGLGLLLWGLPLWGVAAAAIGVSVRHGVQVLLLLPAAGPPRRPDWQTPTLPAAWQRLRPLVAGASYFKLDRVVDRLLSSLAPRGQLSLLALATQLYASAQQVLGKALVGPHFPELTRRAETHDHAGFGHLRRRLLLRMLAITGLGLVALLVAGRPLLDLLARIRPIAPANRALLWQLLVCLSGVWICGGLGLILAASFYARRDTRTPVRVGVVTFTIGIGLRIAGFQLFGTLGIALGASGFFVLTAIALDRLLARQLREEAHPCAEAAQRPGPP